MPSEAMTLPTEVIEAGVKAWCASNAFTTTEAVATAIYHAMSTKLAEQDDAGDIAELRNALADYARAFESLSRENARLRSENKALSTRVPSQEQEPMMTDEQIKHMVERFLAWKLLPCPFCGGVPKTCSDDSYGSAHVWCSGDNGCAIRPEADAALSAGETLADAIRAWNTRAEAEPSEDEVDAAALAINGCFNGLEIRKKGGLPLYQDEAEALARAAIAVLRSGPATQGESVMNDDQIEHMANRFLAWRLPENFNPDAGISFKPDYNENTAYPMKHRPTGTNLLDYTQAEAMVRHMIEGMPVTPTGKE